MEHDVQKLKSLNKIALLHKIYAWICIVVAIASAVLMTLGYSFASLLVAYNLNDLGNAVLASYYAGILFTLLFGIWNLFVAKKLNENNRNLLYFSLFSIVVMIIFRATVLDYLFAATIGFLWVIYFKASKYPVISNKQLLLYAAPVIALVGGFFFYTSYNSKKADDFCTAVYYGATYNEIKTMLDNGFDPNMKTENGLTALYYAQDPAKAKLLLEYGANPNFENNSKRTPLFSLMIGKENHKEFFTTLVQHGADINHQDIDGNTVLHESVFWGRESIVEAILANKPDLTIKNNEGKTVVDIAKEQYIQKINRNPVSEFDLGRAKKVLELLAIDPDTIKKKS